MSKWLVRRPEHWSSSRSLVSARRVVAAAGLVASTILTAVVIAAPPAPNLQRERAPVPLTTPAPNTLTAQERQAGWKLLFDGTTFAGWRGFHRTEMPTAGWVIDNGTIKHVPVPAAQARDEGDIITADQFANFELRLEWRVSPGGNSGVKYLVDEALVKSGYSGVAFEMQVLDDERHPDAKLGKDGNRTAGSLYDLIPPSQHVAKPVGEWNEARVVVQDGHVEHWLNGVKVVEFTMGSPEFKARIAESKFKTQAGFGETRRGHLLLQAHGDEVWFRNLKIKTN